MKKEQKRDGYGSWGSLSAKPRNHNLAKIKIGSYEQSVIDKISLPAKVESDTSMEKRMTSAKRIDGICESCGTGPKKLSAHYGKNVCSTCYPIRIGARNNPDVVIDSLIEFGNQPKGMVAGGNALQDDNERLSKLIEEKNSQIEAMRNANSLLEKEKADLNIMVETLKEQIRSSVSDGVLLDKAGKTVLDKLVWTIAEGIMEGNISGVKVDDLRTMRSLL